MKLKCKKAGQDVISVHGFKLACSVCSGIIIKEGNKWYFEKAFPEFRSVPTISLCGFNCPMVETYPERSDLVERLE